MVHDAADRFVVAFDDERVVANAGVMLPALLASRLGIEGLVDARVDLGDRPGAANPSVAITAADTTATASPATRRSACTTSCPA